MPTAGSATRPAAAPSTSTRGPSRSRSTTRRARRTSDCATSPGRERVSTAQRASPIRARNAGRSRSTSATTSGSRTTTRPATCAGWSRLTRTRTLRLRLPPSPAGPPPPPPAQPDLILTVGPDPRIAAFYADGRPVTNLPPGTYTIQVHDLSATHNFHLTGPGVDEKTSVGDIEHPVWRLTLRAGKYTFKCDVHPTIKGSFTVSTNAPPVPKCKVPRVIGKGLSKGEALDPRRALLGRPRPLPAFEAHEGAHHAPVPGCRPHAGRRDQGEPGRQPRPRVTA